MYIEGCDERERGSPQEEESCSKLQHVYIYNAGLEVAESSR